MRVHAVRALVLLLSFLLAAPALPEEKSDPFNDLLKAAASSAGSSIAMAGAKFVIGKIYDGTCSARMEDAINQLICDGFKSFSGRDEQEWKQKMERKLEEISTRLETIDRTTLQIQQDIARNHKEINRLFLQAASEHEAARVETRIITLWDEFKTQFDGVDADVNREAMVRFARKIIASKLDVKLGDLNVVLTKSIRGSQPLLRFPFYAYIDSRGFNAPDEAFNSDKSVQRTYDFAEKAFMDIYMQQQKLFVMALWAAKVLELDCEEGGTSCTPPPFTAKDLRTSFDRYTRQQVSAFNEGLEWLLMAYGRPHWPDPWFLPPPSQEVLLRANYLNLTLLGGSSGVWGRVISMGETWDGAIDLDCGRASGTIKPLFNYLVPVHGRNARTNSDWWTSRAGNAVYDEVRFSPNWKVFHYHVPDAKAGPCTVKTSLPRGGILPWVQPGTLVAGVKDSSGADVTVGSFLAMQRAGGAYALASGSKWWAPEAPEQRENATAMIENRRYEWTIDTKRKGFPHVGLISAGRGEYKVRFSGGGSRVERVDKLRLVDERPIYFPDNRSVTLNILQMGNCAKTCVNSDNDYSLVKYDVQQGSLEAFAAVFLAPQRGSDAEAAKNNGILADGTFRHTSDRQQKSLTGPLAGNVTVTPNTAYYLHYLMAFALATEGKGLDATEWMYSGKITPWVVYLTAAR